MVMVSIETIITVLRKEQRGKAFDPFPHLGWSSCKRKINCQHHYVRLLGAISKLPTQSALKYALWRPIMYVTIFTKFLCNMN
jgi:hypothetical protein